MKESLKYGNIELKKATPADAITMYGLIEKNRDRLLRVFPWANDIQTVAAQEKFYQEVQDLWSSRLAFHFVIFHEGRHVGALSVHSIVWDLSECQFGYWIDKDAEGKGIVSNSIRQVEGAIRDLGLDRPVIRFHKFNHQSRRVAESLGYKPDPLRKQETEYETLVK